MIEIERKFLVQSALLPSLADFECWEIQQGYLSQESLNTVRVRILNEKGYLTIKSKSKNISRMEFEYEIPKIEAMDLLDLCGERLIEKKRYLVPFEGKIWEVDVFEGKLAGLYLAELELSSEEESFEKPAWIGQEVSLDPRFFNSNLSQISVLEAKILVKN